MSKNKSDEFRQDAVRIALTSGLTRREVSVDLGVGLSTLNKWIKQFGSAETASVSDAELLLENEKLRRENRILKEEREVLKKPQPSSRGKRREVFIHRSISRDFNKS